VKSRTIACLLSRGAINHASSPRQSFPLLTSDSACDNVLLEQRMALDLREFHLIEKIFPVMIGDLDANTQTYGNYFANVSPKRL